MPEHHHPFPRTSHTREQQQVAEINDRLAAGAVVNAEEVGLGGDADARRGRLVEVVYEGSPNFGYVWGHVRREGAAHDDRLPLHTGHLVAISRSLHLAGHHWGI